MLRWWVDDADFQSGASVGTPDVFVLGGVIATAQQSKSLMEQLDRIREPYGNPRLPLKWNFRDAKRYYDVDPKSRTYYARMLDECPKWRADVFDAIDASGVQLLVTAIEAHSSDREKVNARRTELMQYVFTMGLSRFGLHVKNTKAEGGEVVLDWPPRHEREPINIEYRYAYARGTSKGGHKYHCGPLDKLAFADAPFFCTMQHATMLQVADLVVGATKDFLRGARLEKFGPGLECLRRVRGRFRGAPGSVANHGLVVSPGNSGFRETVRRAIRHELFDELHPPDDDLPF